LFLPGLSGLTQGPGFPNLSSLDLLSDRVLGADLTDDSPSERAMRRFDEQQPVR
jgi:mycobactin lysine-N-oxygenase